MSTLRPAFALTAAFVVLLLVACTPQPSASVPTATSTPSTTPLAAPDTVEQIAEGLDAPWSIAFHGGAALVSERDSGRVVEIEQDGTVRVAGMISDATPRGEGGLLGIAVHDGYLYAYFTTAEDNRLERYELTGQPGSIGLGAAETILDGMDAASYHNGGRIAFGPDGMLYVTVGDAGDRASAQDLNSLSGKILRLTPDGGVPADNPFEGSLVYSYGHRNPQGIAWGDGGTLYASEFGQDTWDELNVIEAGGNYGWPDVEGAAEMTGSSIPCSSGRPPTRALAASRSPAAISTSRTCAANAYAPCRCQTWQPPENVWSASTVGSETSPSRPTGRCGLSPATQTVAGARPQLMTASSASEPADRAGTRWH